MPIQALRRASMILVVLLVPFLAACGGGGGGGGGDDDGSEDKGFRVLVTAPFANELAVTRDVDITATFSDELTASTDPEVREMAEGFGLTHMHPPHPVGNDSGDPLKQVRLALLGQPGL